MTPAEQMQSRHELHTQLEELHAELAEVLIQDPTQETVNEARQLLAKRLELCEQLADAGFVASPLDEVFDVVNQAVA